MNLRRLIRAQLGPYIRLIWLVVFLQTVQTAASLTLPALNADIIDHGVLSGDNGFIRRTGLEMLFFTCVQVVFSIGAVWYGARVAMAFGRDVRRDLFHRVTEFSAREVGKFGSPSLITRITNDVQQVQMLVVSGMTMFLTVPLTMTIGIVMALREDVGLSGVLAVVVPATAVILGVTVGAMVPAFQAMQARIDRVNQVLREQITGIRVVRAFVREPEETRRFAGANQDLTDSSLRAGRLMASLFPTMVLIINVSSIAVLWVGGDRIAAGSLAPGSLIAYLSYLVQILTAVMMGTFMVSMIPRAAVSAERIMEVLDTPLSVLPPAAPVRDLPAPGTIEFRAVGFHYPGAEHAVLSGIDFRIGPGTTTAVVGSTGAGKTTLVNLVPRLFDATEGSVWVDGVDVRALDPDHLASTIGFVPQKPYLFSGTVASNLRYGRPEATEAEMWEALEVAQAADFVRAMPGGLEARIAQGGSNVSGGQRQRLAIARALVVRPSIYVFDDSFSALDLATDARLRAALEPHTRESAVLVVAQRVSTISTADQILVLEDGELVGKGTHDELLAACATYREIVSSQLGEDVAA